VYTFLACQSFAGGFDLGVVQAGFEFVHKVEQAGGFGMPNCLANRHLLGPSWTAEAGDYREWHAPRVDVIAANPPCSGFSPMTDNKHRGMDSKINHCMWVLMEYAARVRPTILVMESVRQAYTGGRPLMQRLRDKLEELTGLRYRLYHVMQDAIELGGAARRPRYFMVLSQVPFGVEYPTIRRRPILADIWSDLRDQPLTWESQPYRRPATWWTEKARQGSTTFDGHIGREGLPTRRALDLLEMLSDDGGWPPGRSIGHMAQHAYNTFGRLPESWKHMTPKLVEKKFHMGFASITRWDPNRVGRVIMGSALDLVLHPWQPRTITHREAARVMGFPDNWLIKPLKNQANLRATWGKGISVQCGKWIGDWVKSALDGQPGSIIGVDIGDREYLIEKHKMTPNQAKLLVSVSR
jgi:DNA (cytosine-5)-methyltransferase 1